MRPITSKKQLLFIAIVSLIAFLLAASYLYKQFIQDFGPGATVNNQQGEATADEKQLAPDFTVYDKDGNPVQLSDFRGKPVVLNFWASWCGPCKSEMPDFDKKAAEMAGDVTFLMVNLTDGYQETVESASAFVKEQGFTFLVYYDTDMNAATTYGVSSVPVTYFIDAEGYGIARALGAIGTEDLQTGIDMIYQP